MKNKKEIEKAGFKQISKMVWRKNNEIYIRCVCRFFSDKLRILPGTQTYACPICKAVTTYEVKK